MHRAILAINFEIKKVTTDYNNMMLHVTCYCIVNVDRTCHSSLLITLIKCPGIVFVLSHAIESYFFRHLIVFVLHFYTVCNNA